MDIKQHRINNKIRDPKVRVIDSNGDNLGVLDTSKAIQIARDQGLDLVEVSKGSTPSVCKIIDYNKYLYDQKSKLKQSKQKKTELKEFKFGPNIGDGDLKIRINRGIKFIEQGNMVKYSVVMKGREQAYPEFGFTKLKIVESELSNVAKVEKEAARSRNIISMTFMPK